MEYKPPKFLEGQSVDEIHQRMAMVTPNNLDKTEGNVWWDFTRPTAVEKADFVQFRLNEAIKLIFPQWAYAEYLDAHAEKVGLPRKSANKASGEVEVTAIAGTVIPQAFQFATTATAESPVVIFETLAECIIGSSGSEIIPIQAVVAGTSGNVIKNAVTLMAKPISGVMRITNPEPITGGSAAESDDSLRARIIEAMQEGLSFTGCDSDYVRWAKEVAGVGQVTVIPGDKNPGTVRLVVIDENGYPANETICNNIYNYIISPDHRLNRLAPVNTKLEVTSPSPVSIDISATVILKDGFDADSIIKSFKRNLNIYFATAAKEKVVKYVYIAAELAQTSGVSDFKNLLIGKTDKDLAMSESNIEMGAEEYPVAGEVILNV